MNEWFLEPAALIGFVLALIVLILLVWVAMLGSRLKKLRKQYIDVMGNTGITNIEDVIASMKAQQETQRMESEKLQGRLSAVEAALPEMKSKVGIIRYNAFSDGGNDLSFSLAILNQSKDGVVFSGLHNRESTYIYAKPLSQGESPYPLTPEERKAIQEAK